MIHSAERILTTHTGSIARPDALVGMMREKENARTYDEEAFEAAVVEAVSACVAQQLDIGLDVVNDGEQRKSGFTTYLTERIGGFDAEPQVFDPLRESGWREVAEFPEYYERYFAGAMFGAMLGPLKRLVCRAPIRYEGHAALAVDIANLKAALEGRGYTEAFMSAPLATSLADYRNEYYGSQDDFLAALAEAVREEYTAIVDAGFLIQVDDPGAATLWGFADLEPRERERHVGETIELINHCLRGIPPERIRYHTCFSINQGPHIYDLHLADYAEAMFQVNAQAFSFEAMNTRHLHDYHAFEDIKLPEGKVIVPGMLSHGANWVEHPELIAELTVRYAELVGRENVMIGNDCGFASQAGTREIDPKVGWAKFAALAEGARLASERLWSV